jgi:hypothetical protein
VGRLRVAWKQVERNAGVAGIDDGAFREREEDFLREIQEKVQAGIYRLNRFGFWTLTRIELLNYRTLADRRAAYLAGTSYSVGKGWPTSHCLPDPHPLGDEYETLRIHIYRHTIVLLLMPTFGIVC